MSDSLFKGVSIPRFAREFGKKIVEDLFMDGKTFISGNKALRRHDSEDVIEYKRAYRSPTQLQDDLYKSDESEKVPVDIPEPAKRKRGRPKKRGTRGTRKDTPREGIQTDTPDIESSRFMIDFLED